MSETVLVTGASAGFGAAIARAFQREGHRVILMARRRDKLEAIAAEAPGSYHVLACDVTDEAAVGEALVSLPAPFREISVLVNNAGMGKGYDAMQVAPLAHWREMVDVNIVGLINVTNLVLKGMFARQRGQIINIGSILAEVPVPFNGVYGATKAFVRHFSRGLLADLVGTPIRVTVIEPAISAGTEFTSVRAGDEERPAIDFDAIQAPTAEDIAEAVVWTAARPAHVNVNVLQVMATRQGYGAFRFVPFDVDSG